MTEAARVAIVTGGAGFIGQAIARRLVEDGLIVVVADLDVEQSKRVAADLPGVAVGLSLDVRHPDSCQALITSVASRFGTVDVLVNNAGVLRGGAIGETDETTWSEVTDIDYGGAFRLLRAASEVFLIGDGRPRRVVNMSSVHGVFGGAANAAYASAKAALIGLTLSVAHEWAAYQVTVNAVAPGMIETPMTSERRADGGPGIPPAVRDLLIRSIPLGRLGSPADVAHAVAYLCSPQASFVTGQVLGVDGGGVALTHWRASPLWADARAAR